MNVFFEDEGSLKAGAILTDNVSSLQVESSTGKRLKVKVANVLLRFASPSATELLESAKAEAASLEPGFLWEVAPAEEFSALELAAEYYGATPTAVQQAASIFALMGAPMYFYKRGKGRFKAAPEDNLKSALASVERKAREAADMAEWVAALRLGELPAAIASELPALLIRPDKNSLPWKALEAAANELRLPPVRVIANAGGIPSTYQYHFDRFLFEAFPKGTAFPAYEMPALSDDLPLAEVAAFSIDDANTTEIDDALSVTANADGGWTVGIHIAAPGLAIKHGSSCDAIARARLSTVYMPGNKITMLPEPVIAAFSLWAGQTWPSLSMWVTLDAEFNVLSFDTRADRIPIAANLRHHALDETALFAEGANLPWAKELQVLRQAAQKLEALRGKTDRNRADYTFDIDWSVPEGIVSIGTRERGSPIDKLVAEWMIFVNSQWGATLANANVPGMYRAQGFGKVRMSTKPAPHQGLGVAQYMWSSSPLRRYADLVNQRQLLAVIQEQKPPFAHGDAELFSALQDFDSTYAQYGEFQSRMEYYWCLRWMLQANQLEHTATVIRENLVRFDHLPIVMRIGDLPNQQGAQVTLQVLHVDLIEPTLELRTVSVIPASADAVVQMEDDAEVVETDSTFIHEEIVPEAADLVATDTNPAPASDTVA